MTGQTAHKPFEVEGSNEFVVNVNCGKCDVVCVAAFIFTCAFVSIGDDPDAPSTAVCSCMLIFERGVTPCVSYGTGTSICYEVAITTGSNMGAGTDANVFITLLGTGGSSGEQALLSSVDNINKVCCGQ